MNPLNLAEEDYDELLQLLKTFIPHGVVWAYGSRVAGRSHCGSDVDLVVINSFDETTPVEGLSELQQAIEESNLPVLIDIHDWAYLPESFKEDIKKHKIILWEG